MELYGDPMEVRHAKQDDTGAAAPRTRHRGRAGQDDGQASPQALADLIAHANEVKDYGCHGTGFSSQGAMSPGGVGGADYQTTSVGDTPDADSAGATGY